MPAVPSGWEEAWPFFGIIRRKQARLSAYLIRNSHPSRTLSEDQGPWEVLGFFFPPLVIYLAAGDHYSVTTFSSCGLYLLNKCLPASDRLVAVYDTYPAPITTVSEELTISP